MLVSEDQTKEGEVTAAAQAFAGEHSIQVDFEHGQWWVTQLDNGAQWAVVDTSEGIDFEQVSDGEDL